MICPKCRAEYIRGVTACADCNVPLVDQLPEPDAGKDRQDTRQDEAGFAEISITFNATEIVLVKSILDGAGIAYYIKSDYFTFGRPFEDPVRLYIRVDQLAEALDILKDFNFSPWDNLRDDEEDGG